MNQDSSREQFLAALLEEWTEASTAPGGTSSWALLREGFVSLAPALRAWLLANVGAGKGGAVGALFIDTAQILPAVRSAYRCISLWLATVPTFLFAWTLCLADAFLTASLLLAFHALLAFREEGRFPLAILGGVHLGLALSAKYTALPLGAILLALALLNGGRPKTWKPWLGFALAACIGAGVFAPWAIRNASWTGNPLYPFARSAFPGGAMTDEEAARNAIETGQVATSRTFFRDLVSVPWRLLTNPEPF